MELYTKASLLVWVIFGEDDWNDKGSGKEGTGRSFITVEALQTLVVEIEAVLNDHLLTYQSTEIMEPEPLTPLHLVYGLRITTLSYPNFQDDELTDPTYTTGSVLWDKVRRQEQLPRHFQVRWKREYLTV